LTAADDQSPEFELDDPGWPMPQPFWRSGAAPRRLRVWRTPDGTRFAIITERGPGMSVTNVAAQAYAAAAARWPGAPIRVFEHYPAGMGADAAEHFDEITVSPSGAPVWHPVRTADLVAVLGTGVLDDMPELPPDPCDGPGTERGLPRLPPPSGPGVPDAMVFHGYPLRGGGLVVVETPGGEPIAPLPHYPKHSPDGFGWGGHGSGSAELARCTLIAVLGEQARCRECDGTGTADAGRCGDCEDGITLHPAIYQAFKRAHVASWPEGAEFCITAGEARAWLARLLAATGE
jgi:hypothetical protein